MATEDMIIRLVTRVCELSKDAVETELDNSSWVRELLRLDVSNKVKTKYLFEPLMVALSFQGIGDYIVLGYIQNHGAISYFEIARRLKSYRRKYKRLCARLKGFETYWDCGYRKGRFTCKNPMMLSICPVRTHDLLKGVLNIKAYSFFFYLRDICNGDFVGHIDRIISRHQEDLNQQKVISIKNDLIADFTRVFGVGDKLANMTLSFLLCSDPERKSWVKVGQAMVAVDSLVHNFLHRTGILRFYRADHIYGPLCVKLCNQVLDIIISKIDARTFNPTYPRYFPRFIQYSIWRFCSLTAHNICNGVRIDDSKACGRSDICPVFSLCDRLPLKPKNKEDL